MVRKMILYIHPYW